MKFCTPLVVATAILGAGANAQVENPCIICPDGATAGDDYAPFADDGDTMTCKDIIEEATVYEEGSEICESYPWYETICCPTPHENPCTICPDGATAGDDYALFGDSTTCKDIIEEATVYEAGSEICDSYQGSFGYETICCPTPHENPCTICPDGATAGDDYAPFDGQSTTCKEIIESVKVYEAGSDICDSYQGSYSYEYICCPTPLENPCTICPDGATVGDDYAPFADDGENTTCKEIIESVQAFEAGTPFCELTEWSEYACCPTPLENPCTICPDGATAGDDYAPFADDGENTTCKEIIESVKAFEAGTPFCELTEWSEDACCPTPAENPCTICPDGATVGDDYAPFADDGDTMTCLEFIDMTMMFEAGSDSCGQYEYIEIYCCPTLAENPCICPDGLTVDGDVIIPDSDGLTCEGLSLAKFVSADSDLCDETIKEGGMVCCPATTTEELSSTVAATVASLEESSSTVVATTDAATTAVPEITEAATSVSPEKPEETLSTVTIDESTSTTTASTAITSLEESSSTLVATTAAPESTDAAASVSLERPEETLSTVTIDESNSTTTASTASSPTDQSNSTTQSTASTDDVTELDSGASMFGSGFGGFAFMPVASALYAVAFM